MAYEVQTYNSNSDDIFNMFQYTAIPDALEKNDYILLVFSNNKFLFKHDKEKKTLDIQYEGDPKEYLIIDMYTQQYIKGVDMEIFKEVFTGLVEGLIMVHSKLTAYFIDNLEEAEGLYSSFYIFKSKSEKEKNKETFKEVEVIFIPCKDYHEHQFKNFAKKFNLNVKDYYRKSSFLEEYRDMLLLVKGDLRIPASNIFDFITELKTKDDIVEAKCGMYHLYIYRFDPQKYSKLLLIK